MKVTSTLAVASILSAVLVAAVPIPAEVDTAYYEAITAREIAVRSPPYSCVAFETFC